ESFHPGDVLIVAALTFVAYEGFQLVINAVNDMPAPARQIPRAIYTAIALAVLIYVVMALAAIMAIPFPDIIANKEHALAAGAGDVMGAWGTRIVIAGALLATSSAISGTLFGASRQLAVIASDGYFPAPLSRRRHGIPGPAIIAMAACAFGLILAGSLEVILEFGSVTFLLVSMLMAYANFRMRRQTRSSPLLAMTALLSLAAGTLLIFGYELTHQPEQLAFIAALYLLLTGFAWIFARHARPAPQA
ncbi:MAG: APC family permease, partial [Perlucidibaca sp.]